MTDKDKEEAFKLFFEVLTVWCIYLLLGVFFYLLYTGGILVPFLVLGVIIFGVPTAATIFVHLFKKSKQRRSNQ